MDRGRQHHNVDKTHLEAHQAARLAPQVAVLHHLEELSRSFIHPIEEPIISRNQQRKRKRKERSPSHQCKALEVCFILRGKDLQRDLDITTMHLTTEEKIMTKLVLPVGAILTLLLILRADVDLTTNIGEQEEPEQMVQMAHLAAVL
jgi:hypothetical protein